jgi:hypothetical protein
VRLILDFFLLENRKFPTKESEYSYKDVIQIFEEFGGN